MCRMIEVSGDCDRSDFDGNIILVASDDNACILLCGVENIKFNTKDKI